MAYVFLTREEKENLNSEERVNLLLKRFKKQVKKDDTLWLCRMHEYFVPRKAKRVLKKEHSQLIKK